MDRSRMNIGIIGLGAIAQKAYLPIICTLAEVNPIFCTRNSEILSQLTAKYRKEQHYPDIKNLIQAGPDAAMVHTATDSHFSIVKELLEAEIPTFVDKPLAYNLAEVEILLDLAQQKNVLLYMGFNRRFLPVLSHFKNENASHIIWEKNRVNLPADPRTFIFDDFIHVLDSLRFLSGGKVENLQVTGGLKDNLLERVYIQWQHQNTLVEAKMNRVSGITEERVCYYTPGKKYELKSLDSGWVYENESQSPLGYDPWAGTLYKRGFEAMITDWLEALQTNDALHTRLEDIYETHALCEQVLKKLEKV